MISRSMVNSMVNRGMVNNSMMDRSMDSMMNNWSMNSMVYYRGMMNSMVSNRSMYSSWCMGYNRSTCKSSERNCWVSRCKRYKGSQHKALEID